MLGNFNFPDIDWTKPDLSCTYAIPLLSLSVKFSVCSSEIGPLYDKKINLLTSDKLEMCANLT